MEISMITKRNLAHVVADHTVRIVGGMGGHGKVYVVGELA